MKQDFKWDRPLNHRLGPPTRLAGIDVFYEFDWLVTVGDPRTQFRHGQCLAERIRKECPEGKRPALLLADRDDVEETSFESDTFYVVVINFHRYLERANADASASYFGESGPGLTRMSQLEAISKMSPSEIRELLEAKLTPTRIKSWAAADPKRMEALTEIVGTPLEESHPAPVTAVMRVLQNLGSLDADEIERLRVFFSDTDNRELIDFINDNEVLPAEFIKSVEYSHRYRAVEKLEEMLEEDLREGPWQKWFEENDWVLGSEFVRVLDERPIDVDHIADYLMQAYDGFLDLVEIKRPGGALKFWADAKDHGNYVPHTDLVKAIMQATRYVLEVEREANNVKFLERLEGVKAIKPRCVLIYGRSHDWNDDQREAYRMLNASYHNLSILSFDHVVDRARRMLDMGLARSTS